MQGRSTKLVGWLLQRHARRQADGEGTVQHLPGAEACGTREHAVGLMTWLSTRVGLITREQQGCNHLQSRQLGTERALQQDVQQAHEPFHAAAAGAAAPAATAPCAAYTPLASAGSHSTTTISAACATISACSGTAAAAAATVKPAAACAMAVRARALQWDVAATEPVSEHCAKCGTLAAVRAQDVAQWLARSAPVPAGLVIQTRSAAARPQSTQPLPISSPPVQALASQSVSRSTAVVASAPAAAPGAPHAAAASQQHAHHTLMMPGDASALGMVQGFGARAMQQGQQLGAPGSDQSTLAATLAGAQATLADASAAVTAAATSALSHAGTAAAAWTVMPTRTKVAGATRRAGPASVAAVAAPAVHPGAAADAPNVSAWSAMVARWKLAEPRAYSTVPASWPATVQWGAAPLALVAAGGMAELTLLPALAPGGACGGTAVAEAAFAAAGLRYDLVGLLAISEGLEAVQAFSLLRKLGQIALMEAVLRSLWGGSKPREVFNFSLARPLDPPHGWYWWACMATGGLAAVGLLFQGMGEGLGALLPHALQPEGLHLHHEHLIMEPGPNAQTPTQSLIFSPAGGDQRALPFRARLWLESCVAAPYLEEVFFRGFLLSSLTAFMPVWGAVGVSSAAFAAAHAGTVAPSDLPQLAAMGVVLGLAYVRSRSLTAPFVAHAVNNTVSLIKEVMSE